MVVTKSGMILGVVAMLGAGGIAAALALAAQKPESEQTPAQPVEVTPAAVETVQASAQPQAAPAPPPDDPFVIKRVLPIDGPIKYGEWHWDDAGVPEGPIVITVDLDARVLSIFRDGHEIGAAAVLLGTDEKPTPLGVFPITQKKRHHISNIYHVPMPYMQRLTNDGVALHASQVEIGYASRGCIGMPEPFAAKVFGTTKLGDRVFITRGKTVGLGDSLVDS